MMNGDTDNLTRWSLLSEGAFVAGWLTSRAHGHSTPTIVGSTLLYSSEKASSQFMSKVSILYFHKLVPST